ncbi:MAG: acetylglutamate kinase [Acidimicrobiales bacterium]
MSYVVKLGGHALDSLAPTSPVLVALASDVAQLRSDAVLVHGGGPQIAALLESVGRSSRFLEGLRVTDEATMDYVAMALAQVNTHLVAALGQSGLRCVGLSGVDGATLRAQAVGAPWGRIAATPKVDPDVVVTLWARDFTPVVSPIAMDDDGGLLNCNADAAAGALAGALDAEVLVLLSDVDQLRRDPDDASSALARVGADDVREMLESGAAREGMKPKMTAALDALDAGARRVVLANGTRPHALRDALAGTIPSTEVLA